jgi:hypothetical protein
MGAVFFKIFQNVSGNYDLKKCETISSPTERIDLILDTLKCNLISGEIVPLSVSR